MNALAFLAQYRTELAPQTSWGGVQYKECSIYKNVPIELLDKVHAAHKQLGIKIRVMFRGSRKGHHNGYCLKRDAHSFAVYRA